MATKNELKFVRSLQQKKYRNQNGMFVVEGAKMVNELLASDYEAVSVYTVDASALNTTDLSVSLITERELGQMSGLTQPNTAIGVFRIPASGKPNDTDWILALDDVRDPGNLGTIIRLCDWFGIRHLVCSEHTVDCYNPKVLQATMGSITRVTVGYCDLASYLGDANRPIYGAFMEGEPVYGLSLEKSGILIMGNEGKGISAEIENIVSKKVSIPRYGDNGAESLNVAMATAVFLHEIRKV